MSRRQMKNEHEQRYIEKCMKRLEQNRQKSADSDNRPNEWYDFYSRTNDVLVPTKWVTRLDEANAVNNHFEYLHEKIDDDFPEQTAKVDREALYCSAALHKIHQNEFQKRLEDHQMRWHPVILISEAASSLPKHSTDPIEIEKQLYKSLLNNKK